MEIGECGPNLLRKPSPHNAESKKSFSIYHFVTYLSLIDEHWSWAQDISLWCQTKHSYMVATATDLLVWRFLSYCSIFHLFLLFFFLGWIPHLGIYLDSMVCKVSCIIFPATCSFLSPKHAFEKPVYPCTSLVPKLNNKRLGSSD
jgi:hypothetical protein